MRWQSLWLFATPALWCCAAHAQVKAPMQAVDGRMFVLAERAWACRQGQAIFDYQKLLEKGESKAADAFFEPERLADRRIPLEKGTRVSVIEHHRNRGTVIISPYVSRGAYWSLAMWIIRPGYE